MKKFTITEQHLKLIKEMWLVPQTKCPMVDYIRPYGNSDMLGDIAYILGLPAAKEGVFSNDQTLYMETLHSECTTVLQICMALLKFEIGTYQQINQHDSRAWEKID